MSKKIISAVLAVLMMSSTAALAASAAEVEAEKSTGATGTFKFDMGDWDHSHDVSFYIWAKSADGSDTKWGSKSGWVDSNNWGSKKTFGTKVEGEDGIVESYEIEFLDGYDTFCIMYDPTTGFQTYNCIITENAIGDTCRVTGEEVENPEDSEKKAAVVAFDNAGDCGPQLVVTSTGNIVGTALAPNENGALTLAKFVYNGLEIKDDGTVVSAQDKSNVDKVTEEKIANAISAYGTDADTVWAEFQNLKGQEGFEEYDAKEKAAKKFINPSSAGDDDSSSEAEATDSDKDDDSSSSSSAGSTTTTTGTATTKSSTAAATTTAASTAASTSSTASAEAGAATGDTTGTSAFAVVLVAAAATMILARKKVEE